MALTNRRRRVTQRSLAAGLISLAVLLVSLMEYGDSGRVGVPGAPPAEPRGERGSFLLEPSGIAYNGDGKLMYRWQSESANRDTSEGAIQLTAMKYFGGIDRKKGWTAQARRGLLSADGSNLEMFNEVTIIDLLRNLEIETEAMTIDLKSNRASSDADVLLRTPRGTTTATGMLALPDEGKLKLNQQVQGTYNAG